MAVAKYAPDACIDALLDYVAGSTGIIVCSGTDNPANRAAAIAAGLTGTGGVTGFITMDAGDFAKADDAVSPYGRKVTVAAQSGVEVTATGDATCVVLADATNIRYITTCTQQTLTDGNTVNIPAWKVQVGDPT